jgi:hypothetical protein
LKAGSIPFEYVSLMLSSVSKYTRDPRRYVRPRIPLAYAGLLVIALVAVIGFAAFSPSSSSTVGEAAAPTTLIASHTASARVASAVLAIRVADAETRVATTDAKPTTTIEPAPVTTTEEQVPTTQETVAADTSTTTTKPRDNTPPPLKITSHSDGNTVSASYVMFEGTSEHGAYVRSGPFDADTDDSGGWSLGLVMVDGANRVIVTAIDAAGNTTELKITVHYDKPQTTTTRSAPTTTKPSSATTTAPPQTQWSPHWPADAGGIRDVEAWRSLVEKYWAADRVDCVLGIIKKESRGDPRAYNSRSGAEGLMQHLSKYWKGRTAAAGFRDSSGLYASPYNAEANIAAGAYIAGSGADWYTPWGHHPAYGSCPDSRG